MNGESGGEIIIFLFGFCYSLVRAAGCTQKALLPRLPMWLRSAEEYHCTWLEVIIFHSLRWVKKITKLNFERGSRKIASLIHSLWIPQIDTGLVSFFFLFFFLILGGEYILAEHKFKNNICFDPEIPL